MGAFGAALIAREREDETGDTKMLSIDEIIHLEYTTSMSRCQGCNNHCILTINKFNNDRQFISGNRCERGLGLEKNHEHVPNLYEYKYKRIFGYKSLKPDEAKRGVIGIPRVLNMYENYPFWHTFFTNLSFRVMLSPKSSRKFTSLVLNPFLVSPNVILPRSRMDMLCGYCKRESTLFFILVFLMKRIKCRALTTTITALL